MTTAATRLAEFATGTGTSVYVDKRLVPAPDGGQVSQPYIHTKEDCSSRTKHTIGTYATERTARAAIPKVKACKTCRP